MIRAWWSSRSSKSSPRHFVPGGGFDSHPLRQPSPNRSLRSLATAGRPASRASGQTARFARWVFELAKVKDAHSHRFRDTFAVSLLENGVSIENVSVLVGHSSVRITERHYRPRVKTLQKNLEDDGRRAWA